MLSMRVLFADKTKVLMGQEVSLSDLHNKKHAST